MNRRDWLRSIAALLALPDTASAAAAEFPAVLPGRTLRFPRDEGSHPAFRTEWWYVTGWLNEASAPLGFQITFFRTRLHGDSGNPSRFDPKQILVGHAAISAPKHGRLRHAQRIARAGFGLAEAGEDMMDVRLDHWHLTTRGDHYAAHISAGDLELDLRFLPTQPPLLQGESGYSRKGPSPTSASYYYSLPHLAVHGRVRAGAALGQVTGSAWLDHEWSSEYLSAEAVGWDWIGVNLNQGGALMAFRMRDRRGGQYWAAATLRLPGSPARSFGPDGVRWIVRRWWQSPRTGARYPIGIRVEVGELAFDLEPLMDDQESDTRMSTGTIYWEGAVTATREGRHAGRGYLELTGYAGPLRM